MSPPNHEPEASTFPGPAVDGEPAWEIARLFPSQGDRSEQEYLALLGRR